jgi:hypothetical protein
MKLLTGLLLLTVIATSAQVPVRNEPYHHNIFENKYVRILDVHLPAGDTTAFHIHATPSVFITLQNVQTGSQVLSQDPADTATIGSHELDFTGFYHQPRIHRVWNSDTREYRVMDVELLNKNLSKPVAVISGKGLKLVFDKPEARGYVLTLDPSSKMDIDQITSPVLLVNLSDLNGVNINRTRLEKLGSYSFVPANNAIHLSNSGKQKISLAVVELK